MRTGGELMKENIAESKWTGVIYAALAAALFGASTPFAKLLLGETAPVLLAALLYLGSRAHRHFPDIHHQY
jgi:hypothetical protein